MSFEAISLSSLTDPVVLTTLGAACTAAGAVGSKAFDWWANRGKEKLSADEQKTRAEELMRDDLLEQNRELRDEIKALRGELSEARKELRDFGTLHMITVADWQKRYGDLLTEVAQLRASIAARPPVA